MILLVVIAVLLLSFANGANDNFKGVATLYGSGTTNYRRALAWGTLTTLAGSILAVLFASELLHRFSGKGLVSDELVGHPEFAAALGLGAAITVLLATRLGFPISTTHALVGAMVGAALATGTAIAWKGLVALLLLPLLASPLLALTGTLIVYPLLRQLRVRLGVSKETCLCAGREVIEVVPLQSSAVAMERASELSLTLDTTVTCRERYAGKAVGIDARQGLDLMHFLSAGMVGFARGLNDTPKIAALLLVTSAFGPWPMLLSVGLVMAIGGVLGARRVAESLSHRITEMNAGQGFTSNVMTAFLVTWASRWGLPVSTTHVSCGSLFGIGMVNGHAHWGFIRVILAAWCITAPVAALFGYLALILMGRSL
jgi:inorganic phosphate transporter, PiT family